MILRLLTILALLAEVVAIDFGNGSLINDALLIVNQSGLCVESTNAVDLNISGALPIALDISSGAKVGHVFDCTGRGTKVSGICAIVEGFNYGRCDGDYLTPRDDVHNLLQGQMENPPGISWLRRIRQFVKYWATFVITAVVALYWSLLSSNPMVTNCLSTSLIGTFGDLIAQIMEIFVFQGHPSTTRYDLRRAFSIAAEGLFISGPFMHYSYVVLERVFPISTEATEDALKQWGTAAIHVLIDTFVMDVICVGTLLVTSAILEGRRRQLLVEFHADFVPAVKVSWLSSLCFAPIQCALFRYVHVDLRVLAMNIQDISWNAIMSYMAHRSRQ